MTLCVDDITLRINYLEAQIRIFSKERRKLKCKLYQQQYCNRKKLTFPMPVPKYSKLSRVNSQCKDAQSKTHVARDNK